MKANFPIRNNVGIGFFIFLQILEISSDELVKFENGCRQWPQLKEMTLADLEEGQQIYVRSNCRVLYTFYGIKAFVPRFKEFGIDLSFDNPLGSENYIYHLFLEKVLGPSKAIQTHLDQFTADWDQYCMIGMHIRAGDQALKNQTVYDSWKRKYKRIVQEAFYLESKCTRPPKWYILMRSI